MSLLLDMYWLTFYVVGFYCAVVLVLTSYFQFIKRGAYDFKVQRNKIEIYCKFVYRVRNVFSFYYLVFIVLFLLYRFFYDENDLWFLFFSLAAILHIIVLVGNYRKNKGRFFNIPYRQLEVTNVGIVVNDDLLVYDSEKDRVELVIKKLSTSRSIYYSISISNYYNSIDFIKPIPSYQFKEFIIKLQEFFSNNGFKVEIKEIEG